MAGEQSSGTFVRVPGETGRLRERSGAQRELELPPYALHWRIWDNQ